MTIKEGDWVEGDNGYGIVERIFPEYYQYWESSIPAEKNIGDKVQDIVIVKRLCSFDFKVLPQTRIISKKLTSKVTKKDLATIKTMLKDEKIAKRFAKYKTDDDICEVVNWDLKLPKKKIKQIIKTLEDLENNGNLNMTMREIEVYLKKYCDIHNLFANDLNPHCYIQLISAGQGAYKNKELLFKKIGIQLID